MAGFWTSNTEPLRKNRWSIVFTKDLRLITYALKKADRPSYKTSDITHKFGNYSFYYPGRVEWNTINITFASVYLNKGDSGAGFTDNILLNIFNKLIKPPIEEKNALNGLRKGDYTKEIGDITLQSLEADGEKVAESWQLINPFFTNIKFGDLSYDSEEIVDVECTVRYDSAVYTSGGSTTESAK
jgi:hypothetical protein